MVGKGQEQAVFDFGQVIPGMENGVGNCQEQTDK